MADIIVDTYKLNQYTQRLSAVNSRINRLDRRMDSLYTRVGLLGLWDLMRADALTSYSGRLVQCQAYLQQTARDFERTERELQNEDPLRFYGQYTGIAGVVSVMTDVVHTGYNELSRFAKNVTADLVESYYSHGTVYEVVQYGKALLTAAKGVAKIATGVGSVLGSGGLSTPVAILTIISGCNDVYNSIMDAAYVHTEQYDMVGHNALKETVVDGWSKIGEAMGNERVGEIIGYTTYYGIDIVTSLATLETSMDKIKQLESTNFGKLGTEMKEIAGLDVSKIFTTDINTLRYQTKLASYTFGETANFVSNAGALIDVGKDTIDVVSGIDDIFEACDPNHKNPVLDKIEQLQTAKDFITGVYDITSWDYAGSAAAAKRVDSIVTSVNGELFFDRDFSELIKDVSTYNDTWKSTINGSIEIFS